MMLVILVALVISLYLAWGVGVNTVGTVLGINIGSGVMRLKSAVIAAAFFTVMGALFMSRSVIQTLSGRIVHLDSMGVLACFITVGALLTITTKGSIPIFESYLVIGSIAGYSIIKGLPLDKLLYEKVLLSMFLSPLAAIACGFALYTLIKKVSISKIKSIPVRDTVEDNFRIRAAIGFAILCFALGGNSVGVAVGMLGGSIHVGLLSVIGSIGVVIGTLTWSYKIANIVGIKLTSLSPTRGFSVQVAAGVVIIAFLGMSIPISTTQTLIGAAIGVGLAHGKLEKDTMKTILGSWIIGLPAAIGVAALLGWLL